MPSLDNDGFRIPLAKRQKIANDTEIRNHPQVPGSRIFSPFRTLGLVSPTAVPFTCVRLGKSTFQITTSVGRCLQTYDLRRGLNLVFISRPQTPETITATFAWQDKIFAAWGNLQTGASGGVWVFKRGKKVASLVLPADFTEPIDRVLVFGSWIVGCSGKSICVWKNGSYEYYTSLSPIRPGDSSEDKIYTGHICNMPTYLNKIFVGKYDGSVEIWNVKTGKLIHSIQPAFPGSGPVTVLQPSPVLSVIAIAYRNGAIAIQNVETGQILFSSSPNSSQRQTITSLTFRTDGLGAGEDGHCAGVMATACMGSGDITMWDLNGTGRIIGVLRGAHKLSQVDLGLGVNHIEFLDGQPVIVSSGRDNSLRTWIFDQTPFSPIPRPLHSRRGHSAALTKVSFLPSSSDGSESNGKWLLSASKDCSLWGFSARKDSQSTELSQGSVERKAAKKGEPQLAVGNSISIGQANFKAPEVTCIACSLNRDGGMGVTTSGPVWANPKATDTGISNKTGWESVVTGHRGDKYARTWFWGKKKAGRWVFETGDGTEVKSVAISQCGTFALVGSAGGSINMFNMQSGLQRQSFPSQKLKRTTASDNKGLTQQINSLAEHTKAVTGLAIDVLNQTVVSCGLDGKVKFWDFASGFLVDELDWHPMTAITGLRYNSASELVAFSCDDLSIRVVDMETRKIVRELWGCVGQINDFAFSNDGRWIIGASMDSIIRVWDLPTGHLIDIFRVSSTCTALAMSNTGDFLATAHADGVGVNLWSNRSLFVPVSTRNLTEDSLVDASLPTTSGEGGVGFIEAAFSHTHEEHDDDGPVPSTEQLSQGMLTLSVVPKNKWQTLLHLDLIKGRNMPKEPPKAPPKAPFFLPAPSTQVASRDDANLNITEGRTALDASRITRTNVSSGAGLSESRFTMLLKAGCSSGNFDPFISELKLMAPAKLELEIRSLDPKVCEGHSELSSFVLALSNRLASKRDFELVNAWMAVFLRIHSDIVALCSESDAEDRLREALAVWSRVQRAEIQRLSSLVGYCRGVAGFLRSSR
ncbi:hypothetical protein P175DRAFT_0502723 [Aspergillus ochraceoroseus IBT 24754]|uniref:Uncharacterized protein n=3 Tax=Aspergillus subgen. Nidulantes TaxID=2720870 RepID=A0A0F8V0E5_9EURO|nr:uncharacterized protein P175DRAFT_0502723 [Aspergillus ochraceoroseus IBT 24754]KKK14604.1 hypothetical protein AOCH_002735 [Aspergillus ochraceoroseus]KKK25228.1 hypothetical protein ARAM_006401 [Aspergillus rambellii]PTU19200.1 hypothetical protein P175DRAFT_0502723 [Aspergillus ochraceoroseus IBT 24754]